MISLKQLSAKEIGEIVLDGIKIAEIQTSNDSIVSIRLVDKKGAILDIRKGGSYSETISVSIKKQPETKKAHKVTGTTHNGLVDVSKVFATKAEADKAIADELEASDTAKLEVAEIDVPVLVGPYIDSQDLPF
jgi:carbamoylphosphate synthase small subunit